jgi:DNA-binding CsgD family transcriptional regulator
MNTEKFILYESVYKQAQRLNGKLGEKVAWEFIQAIMEFGLYGTMPDEDSDVWLYGFEQCITSIDAAQKRYDKAVESGKRGGRKPKHTAEEVMLLKQQGLSNKDIAERLGYTERTIESKLKEAREKDASYEKTEISEISGSNLNNNINNNSNSNSKMFFAGAQNGPAGATGLNF